MSQQTQSQDLRGQVVITTGSATNTGSTIAKLLAAAGAKVVVNYLNSRDQANDTVSTIEAAGGVAFAVQGDVCNPTHVARLVAQTIEKFGLPDILVNNANMRSYKSLLDITVEDFRNTVAPTLEGTLLCVQACVPHMKKLGGGAIINIGGGSGHAGVPNRTHVAAAKAGLAGMTGSLAVELAPFNISVNNIVPGRIETPRFGEKAIARPGIELSPMGRSCEQQEIAELVLFLASQRCRFMSGQSLHVNGARYITIA